MGTVARFQLTFTDIMGNKNGTPVLRDEDAAALAKSSEMSVEEVKLAFEAFVKEHPKGKMKPKDFTEMMNKAMPKKDAKKMGSMYSESITPTTTVTSISSSSCSSSISCQMEHLKKFLGRFSECSTST